MKTPDIKQRMILDSIHIFSVMVKYDKIHFDHLI